MTDTIDNPSLMKLKEVCNYLKVTRQTIYRLIKEGQLPATRVGGQWRFRRPEVEKYLAEKKFRYGLIGIDHCYFSPEVLNKYRSDTGGQSAPKETSERKDADKYYLHEQAYDGWVGNRQEYHACLSRKSGRRQDKLAGKESNTKPGNTDKLFVDVHYRKVALKGGYSIVLTPHQYENLPLEEQKHWMNFLIRLPR
jgi:excisionase family DNA binding protein